MHSNEAVVIKIVDMHIDHAYVMHIKIIYTDY